MPSAVGSSQRASLAGSTPRVIILTRSRADELPALDSTRDSRGQWQLCARELLECLDSKDRRCRLVALGRA